MLRKIIVTLSVLGVAGLTFLAVRAGRKPQPQAVAQVSPTEPGPAGASSGTKRPASVPRFTAPAPETPAPALLDGADSPKLAEFKNKVVALGQECMARGDCNPRNMLVEEAGLGFDYNVGPNHPKRAAFVDVIGWSFDERQKLGQRFAAKEITRKEMFAQMREHFTEMERRLGAVLTDQEYQAAMHVKKGESFSKYINVSPEMAEKLDNQAAEDARKSPAADPKAAPAAAPAESYGDPGEPG